MLTRRDMLRGAGAMIALPFLESLPRARRAAPAARALFIFAPNGQWMPDWTPAAEGEGFKFPFILEPLQPHRKHVTVISGLALDTALAHGDGPGDHARGTATFLTCTHPVKTGGANIRAGVSVDQMMARKVGSETRFPSLEVGCEGGRQAGDCDSGYSCIYANNISWTTPTSPATKEVNPAALFARLFSGPDDGRDEAARARARRDRRSVLDSVAADARSLMKGLAITDRPKLDEYLTAVREVERRVQAASAAKPPMEAPGDTREDYRARVELMYELIALAFQGDHARVATLMLGNAGSGRSYPFLDIADGHHHLSHHGKDPDKVAKIRKINRFHAEELARFLTRLAAMREGDATLLDASMVLYGCAITDGDRHDHHDLPVLVAGGGNGTLRGARHLRVPRDTPLANLHLALLDRMGVRASSFGDSTGRLAL